MVIVFFSIIFFDKLVMKRDKPRDLVARHDRNAPLIKRAWHSFLWMVEIFTGSYLGRAVHTNKEPFRRATLIEKRYGSCFMAILPLTGIFISRYSKSFDPLLDSFMYGHRSMLWFYLGFILFAGCMGVFMTVIVPKIPLFVSVPIAIVSWLTIAWLGFTGHLYQ